MRNAANGLFQRTLKRTVRFSGVGLHSGSLIRMTLEPAPTGQGILFIRSDLTGEAAHVGAQWDNVVDTRLCTMLGNAEGTRIGTVEHLMAALRGCGIDNATVTLDGPEVAIMDGSSAPFVEAIDGAGILEQDAPRHAIKILRPVVVQDGDKTAALLPAESSTFAFDIEFASAAIARQSATFDITGGVFRTEISRARTFGFEHEVDAMRRMGLARGGSLDNAIVISGDRILNEDGLRFGDEFVRHKILDAVGDLYLAGAPIVGRFVGHRSGHAMNNRLLHAVFGDSAAWRWEPALPVGSVPAWSVDDRRVVA